MALQLTPVSPISRLRSSAAAFARGEQGGATIWNVTWLLVFAGMAGLSIDASNGYRNIAISQSTSDAAALAGAMALPDPLEEIPFDGTDYSAVTAAALDYAGTNMPWNPYGQVLMPDEIFVGNWSNKAGERRFTAGHQFQQLVDAGLYASVDAVPVNAVRVYLFQDEADRGNGVATSLMHMAGVSYWNVVTTATAMAGYPECTINAIMARKKYCQTTNSEYGEDVCLWADEGFFLQNGNTWNGNIASTPPGANNDNVKDQGEGFHLVEDAPPVDIPFVEDIATWNNGDPGIAYDILSGGSRYAQKTTTGTDGSGNSIRSAPSGPVVRLELGNNGIIGTEATSSWLDTSQPIQVASLDGFASVAGLLSFAQQGNKPDDSGGDIKTGCMQGKAVGSYVEPIKNYDRDILGIGAGEGEGEGGTDKFPDVQFAATPHTDRELVSHTIYYHDDPKGLTIDGNLENVVVVARGSIKINPGSTLADVTLVSLEDKNKAISIGGTSGTTIGAADGECFEEGGVKIYAMSSVTSSSGTQYNGAFIASGGTIGFAAAQDSSQGVALYAAGNIKHESQNLITSCGLPITPDPDNRRHSLVD